MRAILLLLLLVGPLGTAALAAEAAGSADERTADERTADDEAADEVERLARAALERALIARGGFVLPAWQFEIEPSLTYFHASADEVVIDAFTIFPVLAVGEIRNEETRRDILQPALTVRLGLPWGFQVDTRLPYRYEMLRTVRRTGQDQSEMRADGSGIGDIEVGLSYQLLREHGAIPDVLTSFRWKGTTGDSAFEIPEDELPTGTGFHGVQGSLTAVKVRDPSVLFFGASYTANIADTKSIGRVDPGDTWGGLAGLALAINPQTSLNFSTELRFTDRSRLNGTKIPGSAQTVGLLRVGSSYSVGPHVTVDFTVSFGLTRDAPDVQVVLALPYRVR